MKSHTPQSLAKALEEHPDRPPHGGGFGDLVLQAVAVLRELGNILQISEKANVPLPRMDSYVKYETGTHKAYVYVHPDVYKGMVKALQGLTTLTSNFWEHGVGDIDALDFQEFLEDIGFIRERTLEEKKECAETTGWCPCDPEEDTCYALSDFAKKFVVKDSKGKELPVRRKKPSSRNWFSSPETVWV